MARCARRSALHYITAEPGAVQLCALRERSVSLTNTKTSAQPWTRGPREVPHATACNGRFHGPHSPEPPAPLRSIIKQSTGLARVGARVEAWTATGTKHTGTHEGRSLHVPASRSVPSTRRNSGVTSYILGGTGSQWRARLQAGGERMHPSIAPIWIMALLHSRHAIGLHCITPAGACAAQNQEIKECSPIASSICARGGWRLAPVSAA
jgi:hypothetical protein